MLIVVMIVIVVHVCVHKHMHACIPVCTNVCTDLGRGSKQLSYLKMIVRILFKFSEQDFHGLDNFSEISQS